jgi:hypothetical protein
MNIIKPFMCAMFAASIAVPAMAQTMDSAGASTRGGAETHNTNGPNTPATSGYGMNSNGTVYSQSPASGAAQPNQTTGINGTGGSAQSGGSGK